MADAGAPRLVAVLGVGAIPDPDAAVLHADDVGLTRGDGCFEAVRIVTGPNGDTIIENLNAHLERFERSAAGLDLPCDLDAWRALIADTVVAWMHPGDAVLRIILTRGRESPPTGPPTGLLMIAPLPAATGAGRDGVSVVTLSCGRSADAWTDLPWLLGGIKTLSYAINVSATREAHRRGADDALFVSTDGYALEGARSALVWRIGDHLATTRHDGTGVLASTVQAAVFEQAAAEGTGVSYELIATDDLMRTDGAWLLSSGRLVAPILTLDGAALAHDRSWTDRMCRWAGMYGV